MRLIVDNIRSLTLWLAFAWASVSPLAILAQSSSKEISAKYRQISYLEEITEDGSYLVGAEYAVNANNHLNEGFCLLTNLNGGSTLLGLESVYPVVSVLDCENEDCIWTFRKDGSAYTLFSEKTNQGVAIKKKSSSSLVMSAYDWEKWQVDEIGKGLFVLKSQKDESRALGLNWYGRNKIYFGAYKVSGANPTHLRIYKKIVNAFDLPGKAVKPADGDCVAIVAENQVLASTDAGTVFIEASPYLLENNTLAFGSQITNWTSHYVSDDTFSLVDDKGKGLETVVKDLPENMEWMVDQGYLVTHEIPQRYLVQSEQGGLTLLTKKQVGEQHLCPVLLLRMGTQPQSAVNAQGVMRLTGGWSATRLAELDWKGILALDLTELSLPSHVQQFEYRPSETNTLIYVQADMQVDNIDSWENVIACSKEGTYAWKNQSWLYDRQNWFLDREIKIDAGQLTYQREAYTDGKWETIMLPFDAAVPKNFELLKFEKKDDKGYLIFKKSKNIIANHPMLIRYVGPAIKQNIPLNVSCQEGWLKPYENSRQMFSGTYLPLVVGRGDKGVYLLNAEGDTFVRAAAGSRLAPFRAAFFDSTPVSLLSIVIEDDNLTGITPVHNGMSGQPCYTSDGRLISASIRLRDLELLPHGVYIIGGKKYLK